MEAVFLFTETIDQWWKEFWIETESIQKYICTWIYWLYINIIVIKQNKNITKNKVIIKKLTNAQLFEFRLWQGIIERPYENQSGNVWYSFTCFARGRTIATFLPSTRLLQATYELSCSYRRHSSVSTLLFLLLCGSLFCHMCFGREHPNNAGHIAAKSRSSGHIWQHSLHTICWSMHWEISSKFYLDVRYNSARPESVAK